MKSKRLKKRIFQGMAFIISIIVVFQVYIWWIPIMTKPNNSDAILILGCQLKGETPSGFLTERTLKAAELYKAGKAKYIIASGGKGSGENISEAEGMKRILLKEGIPEEAIILEDKSKNTNENIKNSKKVADDKNFKSLIVVSNSFHLRRAKILCEKNNVSASYSGTFAKRYIGKEIYGTLREMPGIIKDVIFN